MSLTYLMRGMGKGGEEKRGIPVFSNKWYRIFRKSRISDRSGGREGGREVCVIGFFSPILFVWCVCVWLSGGFLCSFLLGRLCSATMWWFMRYLFWLELVLIVIGPLPSTSVSFPCGLRERSGNGGMIWAAMSPPARAPGLELSSSVYSESVLG